MNGNSTKPAFPCGQLPRRMFLSDLGLGFTGLAMGATLFSDGVAKAASPAQPEFSPTDRW